MTECERIIKEGILPESFFKEEVKCEFLVTKQRKKIWAVELDLLIKFDAVCKKHGLRYWGDGGTLLGAVRHNGFIPWDDDIDVIMPREDYNKLLKVASDEFTGNYFFLTPQTDSYYFYSFAKLVNLNTTCISKAMSKVPFKQGMFVDIFVLDYVNKNTFERERERIKQLILCCSSYMKRTSETNPTQEQLEVFQKYWTDHPQTDCDEIHRIASNPKYRGSAFVANATVTLLNPKAALWESAWFDKTIWHEFETIKIPMPANIDARLKAQYGDYMQFPPIEQRGTWHDGLLWDPNKSYTEYMK